MMDRQRRIQNGQQILRWIRRQGVVFYVGRKERQTAKRYLREVPRVFPGLVDKLSAIYLYRQSEQVDSQFDGILWKDVTTNAGVLYAVGLSTEAVGRGEMYLQRLFIHELTHIIVPCKPEMHSAEFHTAYQKLLHQYDKATGSCLEAGREISAADRAAVEHMRKNGPPPQPSMKIPITHLPSKTHKTPAKAQTLMQERRRMAQDGVWVVREGWEIYRTAHPGLHNALRRF